MMIQYGALINFRLIPIPKFSIIRKWRFLSVIQKSIRDRAREYLCELKIMSLVVASDFNINFSVYRDVYFKVSHRQE